MKIPLGIEEIRALYGDPRPLIKDDGSTCPAWESMILTWVNLPASLPLGWDLNHTVTRIRVNKAIANLTRTTLEQIYHDGLWHLLLTFDGCYCWRPKRTSSRLSLHAWGAAIDLNAGMNLIGMAGNQDERLLAVFRKHGWVWGGSFHFPDAMHFQAAAGY
jgi:hypothetical protein